MASVAPLVKTISVGAAFRKRAMEFRAASKASVRLVGQGVQAAVDVWNSRSSSDVAIAWTTARGFWAEAALSR